MLRFSKLEKYELFDVQNVIEDIYHLKKIIIYQIYMMKKLKK